MQTTAMAAACWALLARLLPAGTDRAAFDEQPAGHVTRRLGLVARGVVSGDVFGRASGRTPGKEQDA